jgi:hypothetical protein
MDVWLMFWNERGWNGTVQSSLVDVYDSEASANRDRAEADALVDPMLGYFSVIKRSVIKGE